MQSWIGGKNSLILRKAELAPSLAHFIADLSKNPPHRVEGTAVYMTSTPDSVPSALLNNIAHNKVIHTRNVFLTVVIEDVPHVPEAERLKLIPIADGFERLMVRCGFVEEIDLTRILSRPGIANVRSLASATFFSSRDALRPAQMGLRAGGLRPVHVSLFSRMQRVLFISMSTWALNSTDYYGVPSTQVVEMGGQIEL